MRKPVISSCVIGLLMSGTSASGASALTSIGVLTPGLGGTPESQVRAISPGGEFAVGYSTGANIAGDAAIQQPVVWVASSGTLVQLPNPWDLHAQMTGVVILPTGGSSDELPYDGTPAVGMSGNLNNTAYLYKALQSNLSGGTLTRACCIGAPGLCNTSGRQTNVTDERWYTGARREGTIRAQVHRRDPNGTANSWDTGVSMINSVGGTGYNAMVGWDSGNPNGAHRALWLNHINGSVQTPIPGGAHILSEGLGISPGGEPNRWFCGFDTDAGGVTTQAFRWNSNAPSMTLLGRLPSDTGACANDINNAGVAVGYSVGNIERAVIWNASGQIALLQDVLNSACVDTSAWTRLTRATTMTDNGLTIGGYGVWAADGTTRGFVATIPDPVILPAAPTNCQADPSAICIGDCSTLSATPGSGGNTVEWFTESCGGTPVSGEALPSVCPTATTTYYARTKNSDTGCVSATCATVQVSVSQAPTTASVGAEQVILSNQTTSGLSGNTPTEGSGSWSVVSGGTGAFNPGDTTPNATFTHSSGVGPIVLRWTISNPPCTDSSADVTVTLTVPSDLEMDGDVDLDDFGVFEGCWSGPAVPRGHSETCQQADLDGDGDVDQSDFGIFQQCFRGSHVPPDLNCGKP